MDYTVIITHFNRKSNLLNCLKGLNLQIKVPIKVLVINIGDTIVLESIYQFDLEVIQYRKNWDCLPIAAARNLGASMSTTKQLIFLDVDCIPSQNFCSIITQVSRVNSALVMGTPKYLSSNSVENLDFEELKSKSIYHHSRPIIYEPRLESCYELFWSLCFSISQKQYSLLGGFDENYTGYGCEDTDFALCAKKADVPFYLINTEVYHQQHPVYAPPLNNLQSIVKNCNYFKKKWGYWPMADCLADFSKLGYINWEKETELPIQILKLPNEDGIQNFLMRDAPYR